MPRQNNQPIAANNVLSTGESYYSLVMILAGLGLSFSESSTMSTAGINLMLHGVSVFCSKNNYLRATTGISALTSVAGTFFKSPVDQAIVSSSSVVAGIGTAIAGAQYLMKLNNEEPQPAQLRR